MTEQRRTVEIYNPTFVLNNGRICVSGMIKEPERDTLFELDYSAPVVSLDTGSGNYLLGKEPVANKVVLNLSNPNNESPILHTVRLVGDKALSLAVAFKGLVYGHPIQSSFKGASASDGLKVTTGSLRIIQTAETDYVFKPQLREGESAAAVFNATMRNSDKTPKEVRHMDIVPVSKAATLKPAAE